MSAMDALQLYTSYTVLTIVASSVAIVLLSFTTAPTSKQIALIGELRTTLERALQTCERARSAALLSAGGQSRFVGMSNLLSFAPEPHENSFVYEANRLIEALTSTSVATGDFRVSALRRRLSEVRRIEAEGLSLLSALEIEELTTLNQAAPPSHSTGRFQPLVA